MESERPLGAGHVVVHTEQVGDRLSDRIIREAELVGDLGGQIGQPTLAIGFPEPAGTLVLEFGDHADCQAALVGVLGAVQFLRDVDPREAVRDDPQATEEQDRDHQRHADPRAYREHHDDPGAEAERRGADRVDADRGDRDHAQHRDAAGELQRSRRRARDGPQQRQRQRGDSCDPRGERAVALIGGPFAQCRQAQHAQQACGHYSEDRGMDADRRGDGGKTGRGRRNQRKRDEENAADHLRGDRDRPGFGDLRELAIEQFGDLFARVLAKPEHGGGWRSIARTAIRDGEGSVHPAVLTGISC